MTSGRKTVWFDEVPLCSAANKRAFQTRGEARVAERPLRKRFGKRFRPYVCQSCGLWHLTSQR